ncbi:hypothetical protein C942_01072 [Photobacterium marinum]|uniref:Uncharacterized protein n=1 Tax=Photobacterium marinum TaxID=1056511 RepID=L8JB35_9GAMM|nr:hypothetical protein C942_01072 [Photobacterium marinum]
MHIGYQSLFMIHFDHHELNQLMHDSFYLVCPLDLFGV